MHLHILSPFASTFGGTEQGILQLHRALAGRCDLTLWSEAAPDARLARLSIRRIDPDRASIWSASGQFAWLRWLQVIP